MLLVQTMRFAVYICTIDHIGFFQKSLCGDVEDMDHTIEIFSTNISTIFSELSTNM